VAKDGHFRPLKTFLGKRCPMRSVLVKWPQLTVTSKTTSSKTIGPKAPHGDIISRFAYPMQLHPQITALPRLRF